MTVQDLIEKLQQIVDKDQEIFVSINNNDGLDIVNVTESPFAAFIDVCNEEKEG